MLTTDIWGFPVYPVGVAAPLWPYPAGYVTGLPLFPAFPVATILDRPSRFYFRSLRRNGLFIPDPVVGDLWPDIEDFSIF